MGIYVEIEGAYLPRHAGANFYPLSIVNFEQLLPFNILDYILNLSIVSGFFPELMV